MIRGKKGPGGCTVKKTETALVIGVYAPPVSPGDCSVVVENLGCVSGTPTGLLPTAC